jgi:hypothetical protein
MPHHVSRDSFTHPLALPLPPVRSGLVLLLAADEHAREFDRLPWEFAVELGDLLDVGLTATDVRRLLCDGHAEQRLEVTKRGTTRRHFRPVANLSLAANSCFVLTERGAALARLCRSQAGGPQNSTGHDPTSTPHWDKGRKELQLGDRIVRRGPRSAVKTPRRPGPSNKARRRRLMPPRYPARQGRVNGTGPNRRQPGQDATGVH